MGHHVPTSPVAEQTYNEYETREEKKQEKKRMMKGHRRIEFFFFGGRYASLRVMPILDTTVNEKKGT